VSVCMCVPVLDNEGTRTGKGKKISRPFTKFFGFKKKEIEIVLRSRLHPFHPPGRPLAHTNTPTLEEDLAVFPPFTTMTTSKPVI